MCVPRTRHDRTCSIGASSARLVGEGKGRGRRRGRGCGCGCGCGGYGRGRRRGRSFGLCECMCMYVYVCVCLSACAPYILYPRKPDTQRRPLTRQSITGRLPSPSAHQRRGSGGTVSSVWKGQYSTVHTGCAYPDRDGVHTDRYCTYTYLYCVYTYLYCIYTYLYCVYITCVSTLFPYLSVPYSHTASASPV